VAVAAFKLWKRIDGSTEYDTSKNPTLLSANVNGSAGSYPVAIPSTPSDPANYSYECYLQLECTVAPDTKVENLKVYGPNTPIVASSDSANPYVSLRLGTTGTFTTPVQTASSVASNRQDTTYYSVATALSVGVVPGDSLIDAINERSNYIVVQLKVINGASTGAIPTTSLTLVYDES
jgi:hypothetical protein